MSISVCVNRTIDGDLGVVLMEAVSGQTGSLYLVFNTSFKFT